MHHLESPTFSEFLLTASVLEILIPKAPEIPKANRKTQLSLNKYIQILRKWHIFLI